MLDLLKKHKILTFLALLYIIPRVLIFSSFNNDYMGGDAYEYEKLALSQKFTDASYYLSPNEEIEKKFENYSFENKNFFPYGDLGHTMFWDPGWIFILSQVYEFVFSRDLMRIGQHIALFFILFLWWKIIDQPKLEKKYWPILLIILTHPFYTTYPQLLYTEIIDNLLIVLIYFFFYKNSKKRIDYIWCGFVLGYYAITEAGYLSALVLLTGFILVKYKSPILNKVLLLVCALAPMTPVLYHNYAHGDGAIRLSSKMAFNFWNYNNHYKIPSWDQNEVSHPLPNDYFLNVEKYPEIRKPCYVPFKDQTSCERSNAIKFALNNPLKFTTRGLQKLVNLYSPNIFPYNKGYNSSVFKTSDKASALINNIFTLYEVFFISFFFLSVSFLILTKFKLKSLLFSHFLFFHIVTVWHFGQCRYRLGMTVLMTVSIFYFLKNFNTKILKDYKFWILNTIFAIFLGYTFYSKYHIVFYSI